MRPFEADRPFTQPPLPWSLSWYQPNRLSTTPKADLRPADAIHAILEGEIAVGLFILCDLVNAQISFKELAWQISLGEKSLHRMLGRNGNPKASECDLCKPSKQGWADKKTRPRQGLKPLAPFLFTGRLLRTGVATEAEVSLVHDQINVFGKAFN